MGPVEKELRLAAERGAGPALYIYGGPDVAVVLSDAILAIVPEGQERWTPWWPEIMSEAIEAAEYLCL